MDEILKPLLAVMSNDSETLAVFAYGSRVEGLSNKYSDLDVCIVTKSQFAPDFMSVQGIDVHLEKVPLSHLENAVLTARDSKFDYRAVLWCHRINVGSPILDAQGVFQRLRERIDLKSISRNLVLRYCTQATLFLNDSLGAFESEDFETALMTARLGVENAVMAYLSSVGIINPYNKWMYRYLLRVRGSDSDEVVEHFRILERQCVSSNEEIKRYIETASNFINKMTTQAQSAV